MNDRLTRRLVGREIVDNKLVVLLARSGKQGADQRLKEALKRECFIVHEIRLVGEKEQELHSSDNSIKTNPNLNNQILEAGECLDETLAAQGRKLHAVISLPKSADSDDGRQSEVAKSLQGDCIFVPPPPLSSLLLSRDSSLSHTIIRSGARVIRVLDTTSVCQKTASLFKLYGPLEGTISEHLRQEPSRLGQHLIDIKIIRGARMSLSTMGSFIKSLASNLNNGDGGGGDHIAGNKTGKPSEGDNNEGLLEPSSSPDDEPSRSDSCSGVFGADLVEDKRTIEAIVESVVRINPARRRKIIF